MSRLYLKNGRVVDPEQQLDQVASVLLEEGESPGSVSRSPTMRP